MPFATPATDEVHQGWILSCYTLSINLIRNSKATMQITCRKEHHSDSTVSTKHNISDP